jgi:hypothetical protein
LPVVYTGTEPLPDTLVDDAQRGHRPLQPRERLPGTAGTGQVRVQV